ncbi:MAG: choice-of-anchor D domain-containing protein, partial [Verrucomicrobiota bacterium]
PPQVGNGGGPLPAVGEATMRGNLMRNPADVTIYWGTTDGGTDIGLWDNSIDMGLLPIGNFQTNLSGLLFGVQYYTRNFATNAFGFDWPLNTALFKTLKPPATDITNLRVTNLTTNSAVLNADFNGVDSVYDVDLYWGPTDGGTDTSLWSNVVSFGFFTNQGATNLSHFVGGLTGNETNFYSWRITNCAETVWGGVSQIFEPLEPPAINNDAGAVPGVGQADLQGDLTAGSEADITVYYGLTDGGITPGAWDNSTHLGFLLEGPFQTTVTGLTFGVEYFYRTRGTNQLGLAWAPATTNFKSGLPPEAGISNNAATNVTLTTADLSATFNGTGSIFEATVYWGTTDGGTAPPAWSNNAVVGTFTNQGATNLIHSIGGLDSSNTYYYTWRITNCATSIWATPSVSFFQPDIQVLGINGSEIPDGLAADEPRGSDFGTAETFKDRTFTIQNAAFGTLMLTGAPLVSVTGSNAADFVVITPPADTSLGFGESTTFTVRFTPGAAGTRIATVSISSTDVDEPLIAFDVSGQQGVDADGPSSLLITVCGYDRATLNDFPVLLQLSTNILGFRYDQFSSPDDGADLRVINPFDGLPLNYEIDSWDTNGTSYVWVQVPAFAQDQCIRLTWGSAALVGNPAPLYSTNGATWSNNYQGVWHLSSTGGPALDATPNNNDGTVDVGVTRPAPTGAVNGAYAFNGVLDDAQVNLAGPINFGNTDNWSVSFWARQDNVDSLGMIVGDIGTDNSFIQIDAANNRVRFRNTAGLDHDFVEPAATADLEHFVLESDGSGIDLIRQGIPISRIASADVSLNIDALGR